MIALRLMQGPPLCRKRCDPLRGVASAGFNSLVNRYASRLRQGTRPSRPASSLHPYASFSFKAPASEPKKKKFTKQKDKKKKIVMPLTRLARIPNSLSLHTMIFPSFLHPTVNASRPILLPVSWFDIPLGFDPDQDHGSVI
jgi:hypothetical protein